MNKDLLIALMVLLAVVVWVVAKVRRYTRQSERQWQELDKTKLRKWEDDVD